MRNLIYAINLTLDGCCDHTKGFVDDELHEHYTELLREVDPLVYGRKTYQLMVPYWANVAKDPSETKADRDFAEAFVSRKKVVFSRSLDSAEVKKDDKNAKVISTDLREEILKLKNEPGKPIMAGGVDIPSQLTELGLVDEYRIVVMPVIAGKGRRLFDGVNLPDKLKLRLVETKSFKSGFVALRYLKQ
ncbi:MAG: dihydrofolate reductase family protein [Terriglobales bacterium]|jgi:dihydrofolate reductase